AARLFAIDHIGAREERRRSVSFGMVEDAKRRALARELAPAASSGLLAPDLGLLRDHRYPRGAVIIWRLPEMPADGLAWNDVARVLGIQTWNRWDGPSQRLLVGAPVDDDQRLWSSDGLSLLVASPNGDADHVFQLEH